MSFLGGIGRRRRRAFTIIELLVVISIIMILAGLVLAALGKVRVESRVANCKSNLRNIGTALAIYAKNHGGSGDPDAYPPWLTYLAVAGGKNPYIPNSKVFICPADGTHGKDGGRPNHLKADYGSGLRVIDQFEMADIDQHGGTLNGTGPKNSTDGGVNCSYLFEYSGEPCDWVYYEQSPPIGPSTTFYVPKDNEWEWQSDVPDEAKFLELADRDGDGVLSWNEVKVLSRKGCDAHDGSKHYQLRGWEVRVPIARCYWHVEGGALSFESRVLNLRGDASATEEGELMWFKD
jgi:type II secretory pathway pseudopilin PulG